MDKERERKRKAKKTEKKKKIKQRIASKMEIAGKLCATVIN